MSGAEAHVSCFFFFQAEDGIRDLTVTGVQTCALPIFSLATSLRLVGLHVVPEDRSDREVGASKEQSGRSTQLPPSEEAGNADERHHGGEIGRASCRERV